MRTGKHANNEKYLSTLVTAMPLFGHEVLLFRLECQSSGAFSIMVCYRYFSNCVVFSGLFVRLELHPANAG